MLPLVCHAELRASCIASYAKRLKCVAVLFIGYAALFACLLFFLGPSVPLVAALIICLVMVLQVTCEKYLYGDALHIVDRARFFAWMLRSSDFLSVCRLCVVSMACVGGAQLLIQSEAGGFDGMYERFGGLYVAIQTGEPWRLLTTSLMHESPVHFFSNAALLFVSLPFVFLFTRWLAIAAFLVGCIGGALLQWQLMPQGEGLIGASGGIFAVYGAALAITVARRRYFPAGLFVQVAALSVVSIVAASAFGGRVAHVTHVAGFLLGLVTACLFEWVAKTFRVEDKPGQMGSV